MRQPFSCFCNLGGTSNLIRSYLATLSKYFKGLADFRQFDNFSRFYRNNSAENCRSDLSKNEKMPLDEL